MKRRNQSTRDTENASHQRRRNAPSSGHGTAQQSGSDGHSPDAAGSSALARHLRFTEEDEDEDDSPPPAKKKDGVAPLLGAHAVRNIEKFFGEANDDVENWIFGVESSAKLANLSGRARVALAANALKGNALSEFRSFAASDVHELSWKDFVAFMRDRFGPLDPCRHWTKKLLACKQGSRESVRSFSSRFRKALSSLRGIEPDAVLEHLVVSRYQDGLRKELQGELSRKPAKTLSKAVATATMAESVRASEEGVFVTSTASGSARAPPSNDIQTKLLQTLVQQQSQLLQQNSQILQHLTSSKPNPFSVPLQTPASARSETQESQSASRNAKFCNYCKKSGHVKDECFKLQRGAKLTRGLRSLRQRPPLHPTNPALISSFRPRLMALSRHHRLHLQSEDSYQHARCSTPARKYRFCPKSSPRDSVVNFSPSRNRVPPLPINQWKCSAR